jgi:hypothetical protein
MTGTDELWHGERILSRDDFVKMENIKKLFVSCRRTGGRNRPPERNFFLDKDGKKSYNCFNSKRDEGKKDVRPDGRELPVGVRQ